jgi:hypothetical protein
VTSGDISPIISQAFYRCHNRFIRSDSRVEICANKVAFEILGVVGRSKGILTIWKNTIVLIKVGCH